MKYSKLLMVVSVCVLVCLSGRLVAQDNLGLPERTFPQLEQILERASKQSPRMLLRNLDLVAAEGDRVVARSGLYPTLGGYFQYTYAQDKREDVAGTLEVNKIAYNLQITQPLFYWNERRNSARAGELRKKIAEEQYQAAYGLLAQEIRTAYLRLIVTKAGAKQAIFNREVADANLRSAEDRRAKNTISDAALFDVGIATDQLRNAAEAADSDFLLAKSNFTALTGEAPPSDDQIPDEIPFQESSQAGVDRLAAAFLAQPEAETRTSRIYRQQTEVDDLNYRNTKKRLLPKVSGIAGLSQDQQSYTINSAAKYSLQSQFIGVSVSWTIFDGFATRGAIASSLARKRQSEAILKQYNDTLGASVQNLVRRIAISYRQMNIADRLFDGRRNFLKSRKDDFVRGDASEADVNAAQLAYNNAFSNAMASRSSYMLQLGDLLALVSEDPAVNKVSASGSN